MKLAKRLVKYVVIADVVALAAALIAKLMIRPDGDANSDEFTSPAILSGRRFESRAVALRRGTVIAVMGGSEIDLREAHIAPGAEVTVFALWSGVAIRVPAKWNVVGESHSFMGDARFSLDHQDDLPPDAPTIIVNSRAIMGGVVVTNREHADDVAVRG